MRLSIALITTFQIIVSIAPLTSAAPSLAITFRVSSGFDCLPTNCQNERDCAPPGCFWEEIGPSCAESCRIGNERERDLCDGSCCHRILCSCTLLQ
ncbi:hypothetical protein BDZ97DRAFT_1820459 [Flammula alnicola]|nr:hypothetical protein BDZ97DRAFT_1820459 [Flammula alnicola]